MGNNSIVGGVSGCNNMTMMGQQMGGGGMSPNNMAMGNNVNPQPQIVMMNNMHMMQQKNNVTGQPQQGIGGEIDIKRMNNMHIMQQKTSTIGQHQQGTSNMSNMSRNGMMMLKQQQGQLSQINNLMGTNNDMMMQGGDSGEVMHQQQGGHQYGKSSLGGQVQPLQKQPPNQMNIFSDFGNFGR